MVLKALVGSLSPQSKNVWLKGLNSRRISGMIWNSVSRHPTLTTDYQFLESIYWQWRNQKFSTGDALISGFPSYLHNPLLIYLIHYVTKYFSEKIMCKIRLDDSCLNHLTNIPVGFTRKSSYIHTYILRNHIPKILCILLTGGAFAPDATPLYIHVSGRWARFNTNITYLSIPTVSFQETSEDSLDNIFTG